MRDYIVLAILLGSVPVCFVYPYFGVLMWFWVSILTPHRYAWSIAHDFPAAAVIAIPTLLGSIFGRKNPHFLCREVILLVNLWLWFCVTVYYARQVPIFSDHVILAEDRLSQVSKILLMTILTIVLVCSKQKLKYLLMVVTFSFGILAVKGALFGIATAGEYRVYGSPGSFIGDNNDFALALNMTMAIPFFLARHTSSRLTRLALRAIFFCSIACVILSYSRGGLLGVTAALSAIAVKGRKKLISLVLLVIAGITVFSYAPSKWVNRMDAFLHGNLDQSAEERLTSWAFAWNLVKHYPLTGAGFECFTDELYRSYGTRPFPNGATSSGPHSIYFQLLAEQGFVGTGLFFILLGCCWFTLRKIRRIARRTPSLYYAVDYTHMLEIGMLAYLVSGAFLGRAYFDLYFFLVACTVVLKLLCKQELLSMHIRDQEHREAVNEPEPVLA